jgi:Alpha/beta hydrolase family
MPENSTNVRSNKAHSPFAKVQRLVAFVERWLGARAAAWLSGRLFFRTRRQSRPEREALWLAGASRFEVHGQRPVVAWSFGDPGLPTAILVHGWEGRGAQLGAFVDPLLAAGFRVVTYDAPAHGEAPGGDSTIPEHAQALLDVARAVGGVDVIVAHSFGAAATTLALSRGLEVARVVYVAPMTVVNDAVRRFAEAFALRPATRAAFERVVERRAGATMASIEGEHLAPSMRTPLRVFHDAGDSEVPVDNAERLVAVWPGAQLVRTAGLGHRRILRDAATVAESVDFLAASAPIVPLAVLLDRELFRPSLRRRAG